MKLKGEPNRVVQKKVRKPKGRHRIVPWFRFDENGYVEIDESKLSAHDRAVLISKFGITDYLEMGYQELQKAYSDKTGKSGVGMKRDDMLKEL